MSVPLLVEFYLQLPQPRSGDDPDLWAAGLSDAMRHFRDEVTAKYTDGTLLRLLRADDVRARRAAALALGLIGEAASAPAVAAALREDDDTLVRRFAADALWELWFRAGTPEQNRRLERAAGMPDAVGAVSELDDLIREAPDFAEAYNQRAIAHFRRGDYARSADDCEAVLRLNPHHFGAASGLGQCLLKLKKPRAALRAFRQAIELNPTLEHLTETIQALVEAPDGGRKDER